MVVTREGLAEYDPDVILVAPCGFDGKRAAADSEKMWRHEWWRELRAVKEGKVTARLRLAGARAPPGVAGPCVSVASIRRLGWCASFGCSCGSRRLVRPGGPRCYHAGPWIRIVDSCTFLCTFLFDGRPGYPSQHHASGGLRTLREWEAMLSWKFRVVPWSNPTKSCRGA